MEAEADLFAWQPGDPPRPMTPHEPPKVKRECRFGLPAGAAKGYAEAPGTGPEGQFCKTCGNVRDVRLGSFTPSGEPRRLYKCELQRETWTKGRATDVLLKSPACSRWIPEEETP